MMHIYLAFLLCTLVLFPKGSPAAQGAGPWGVWWKGFGGWPLLRL